MRRCRYPKLRGSRPVQCGKPVDECDGGGSINILITGTEIIAVSVLLCGDCLQYIISERIDDILLTAAPVRDIGAIYAALGRANPEMADDTQMRKGLLTLQKMGVIDDDTRITTRGPLSDELRDLYLSNLESLYSLPKHRKAKVSAPR